MVNKPVHKIKFGAVNGAIWQNEQFETQSVTLERNYKDAEGNWKSTNSLRANDLPAASLVLNRCYEWILTQRLKNPNETV